MLPVIPEVEDEHELVSLNETGRHFDPCLIERFRGIWIRETDLSSIRKPEVVEMRKIPSCEMEVDRICQVAKSVTRANEEDAARWRVQVLASTASQLNPAGPSTHP